MSGSREGIGGTFPKGYIRNVRIYLGEVRGRIYAVRPEVALSGKDGGINSQQTIMCVLFVS